MSKFDNQILAIESEAVTKVLNSALQNEGFVPFTDKDNYEEILTQAKTGRRGDLEEDPNFKQIIPYLVLQDNKKNFLCYTRATGTGDTRIHHKLSIGVGGHIEIEDIKHAEETILHALKREVHEEFGDAIEISEPRALGLIYREDSPIDRVHIGILFLSQILAGETDPNPEEIAEVRLVSSAEFAQMMTGREYDPETWTKIAWEYLQQRLAD